MVHSIKCCVKITDKYEPIPCEENHQERACKLQSGCKYWPGISAVLINIISSCYTNQCSDAFMCTNAADKPPCHRLHNKDLCALNPVWLPFTFSLFSTQGCCRFTDVHISRASCGMCSSQRKYTMRALRNIFTMHLGRKMPMDRRSAFLHPERFDAFSIIWENQWLLIVTTISKIWVLVLPWLWYMYSSNT